jgi:hypothetical protein
MSQQHDERIPSALTKEKCIQMQLPIQTTAENIQPSVKGQLIQCAYSINLYADMDGLMMCCGETPQIERFMTIYPSQLPCIQPSEVPPDWHPQVMKMVQMIVEQIIQN